MNKKESEYINSPPPPLIVKSRQYYRFFRSSKCDVFWGPRIWMKPKFSYRRKWKASKKLAMSQRNHDLSDQCYNNGSFCKDKKKTVFIEATNIILNSRQTILTASLTWMAYCKSKFYSTERRENEINIYCINNFCIILPC